MTEPTIQWDHWTERDAFCCRVIVPRNWLMELSQFKRKLRLWWWLTKLAWSLPK